MKDKCLKTSYWGVKLTFVKIDPRVMGPDLEGLRVEDSKAVDDVGAQLDVDVLWQELALVKAVGCPVGKICRYRFD